MATPANRTLMCSVVFLDMVGYSRKSVSDQLTLKERFNAALAAALAPIAAADRLVLDTGDGAAISFFCNPEQALFVATDLCRRFGEPDAAAGPSFDVRIGINLGPAMLIKDVNGQPNVVGDGINVAQRVMSFAEPGTVLASRSFYEVVSRLADDFGAVFHYEGTRTDKHVREHDVYAVGDTRALEERIASTRAAAARWQWTIRPHIVVATLLIGGAMVAAGALHRGDPEPVEALAAVPSVASAPRGPAPGAAPAPAAVATTPVETPVDKSAASASSPDAQVKLVILPWGEIWLDGQVQGISPPLKQLTVPPGLHTVEARNAHFPPYAQTIDARAGGIITLRHRFQ